MVILLTLITVNYRAYEKRSNLNFEAQKIVSILKQVQMMALTGKETNTSRPDGYGIYFPDNISYFLFADQNANYIYDTGEEIENFDLPANMTVNYNKNNIIFAPPEAEVYFNGAIENGKAIITFQYAGISETKEVKVMAKTGKIE